MSLLEQAFEKFIFMNKSVIDDGYGGTMTDWSEGAIIPGVMIYNGSNEMRIAQALGSQASYTFTCKKDLFFGYHDVLKRQKDGQLFRITNNADDYRTPPSASLNMRQYDAEQLTALPR